MLTGRFILAEVSVSNVHEVKCGRQSESGSFRHNIGTAILVSSTDITKLRNLVHPPVFRQIEQGLIQQLAG